MMRIVIAAILAMSVAGCATVSVYPIEASMSRASAEQKSDLRVSAEGFCKLAEAKGWVAESKSLIRSAQALFEGEDLNAEAQSYADRVEGEDVLPTERLSRIAADANMAGGALAAVNIEAQSFLADSDSKIVRSDVMEFEKALVWAQKSHRAFAGAVDTVSGATAGIATDEADRALIALAVEIDAARDLADALTTRLAAAETKSALAS